MTDPRVNEIERRLAVLERLVEIIVSRLSEEADSVSESRGALEALHSRFASRLKGGRS